MTEDEASHLEQVAEAAVRALAGQLIWTPYTINFATPPGFVWEVARLTADGGMNAYYEVNQSEAGGVVSARLYAPHSDGLRHFYADVAQARTACERHHATGQWE